MLEQPAFGRRLKELRVERSLSQAALAGKEISTGYLSRLESGARQPTERVVNHLVRILGVERSAFDTPPSGGSLAQALSLATSAEGDQGSENLIAVLAQVREESPFLRWQALWHISRYWQRRGERAEEQACLEDMVRVADELSLPELQCRARFQLARSLRSTGEVARALDLALDAYQLAKDAALDLPDTGGALLTLVSVEAEAGRLPDARAHVDELVDLVAGRSDTLAAEALWSAATVRFRQGDHEGARSCLERAMKELDSSVDLTLWTRLRLAAASLYLQSTPPQTERGRERLQEAASALALIGTPVLDQELLTLQTQLAFHEGRYADARRLYDELNREELRLTYRDQVRLHILDSRLMILEGREQEGIRLLKDLGEQAQQQSNIDLAAEIWRILAECLEDVSRRRTAAEGA
ncbi:helix-turn-helix domain-containing protein [Streptomyces sp. MBT65]|uniref:helix-turn-helix domain-containing protein n=1 Tax=Streptomyces sp. MBT65 TaxID=1488395 RepID=UPI00190CA7CF|nr:helix-turn-helix domain-containing protein [Streptomyces sp. MBT65]MBK3580226.1 helix-turn-helix domain-containing protein [Streptomyces sp. MBT65]